MRHFYLKKKREREKRDRARKDTSLFYARRSLLALLCTLTFTSARTSSSHIVVILRRFVPHAPCRVQMRRCSPVRERLWESKGTRTAGEWYLLKRKGAALFLFLPPLPLSLFLFLLNIRIHTFFLSFSPSRSLKKRESLPRDARPNGGLRHARKRAAERGRKTISECAVG